VVLAVVERFWTNPYKISLGEGFRVRVKIDKRVEISSTFTFDRNCPNLSELLLYNLFKKNA